MAWGRVSVDDESIQIGYGPGSLVASGADICQDLEPSLVARKGRLTLLASDDVDPAAIAWLCHDYYGNRSFDVIPTLVHSLSQAYRDHPELEEHLFLALVQRGLDTFMVGTARAVVRLARYDVVRDLYDPEAAQTGYRVSLREHPSNGPAPTLYSTVWRVVRGDMMLVTLRSVAARIGTTALVRASRQMARPERVVRSLARSLPAADPAPLIIVRYSQISPVPDVPAPPRPEGEPTPAPHIPRPRRQGVSPLLIAGLLALASVLYSAWATGTQIKPEEIPGYLQMYFFPEPTPTATPTLSPEEVLEAESRIIYVAPQPVAPYNGARVTGSEVSLIWDWEGEIQQGERFEVTVVSPGGEPEVRTLTRERMHRLIQVADGWYTWTVRIVDATQEDAPVGLSRGSDPVRFHWGSPAP